MRALVVLALVVLLAGCVASSPGATQTPADAKAAKVDCLATLHGVDLHRVSIADLQRALAAGNLTSVELVDAYAARIAAFDAAGPKLNSVQGLDPTAREWAAKMDAERKAGHVRGPLHGIPILLKDNVGTNDMPTTAGSIALEKNVPKEDATITAKLRDAGAIILGKTHLSEFANWVSLTMPNGYSSLGGQVVNAYTMGDPSGSSSGSGVAGSMAFAAAAIGTETSGSILSPSNANSLVGVKPTMGLNSRQGIIPLAANFDVPGPMARNVEDAALVLTAMAGPDPKDPVTAQGATHATDYAANLSKDALRGAKLGYDPQNTDPIFDRARKDLEALGATLVPIEPDRREPGSTLELALIPNEFKFGLNDYLAKQAGPGLPVKTLDDIVLYNQQHPDKVKYGQDLLVASDSTPGLGPLADANAAPFVAENRMVADGMLAGLDALVGPDAPYTGLGAAAGYPTVVVPAGYQGKNPEGLSFFGPAWSEAKLLGYAYAYEQATHRREPPTVVNAALLDTLCG